MMATCISLPVPNLSTITVPGRVARKGLSSVVHRTSNKYHVSEEFFALGVTNITLMHIHLVSKNYLLALAGFSSGATSEYLGDTSRMLDIGCLETSGVGETTQKELHNQKTSGIFFLLY